MRNTHDLGGMVGYGKIDTSEHATLGHEPLAFGLTLAAIANGFLRNVDENRYAKERLDPSALAQSGYFELWLAALEMNLVEHEVLSLDDIEQRSAQIKQGGRRPSGFTENPKLTTTIDGMLHHAAHPAVPLDQPAPRFAVGDLVRTRVSNSRRHTRLPVYAMGRAAVVIEILGPHSLPDVVAHEDSLVKEWTYQVRFDGHDLWGEDTGPHDSVQLDVWESYIDLKETA